MTHNFASKGCQRSMHFPAVSFLLIAFGIANHHALAVAVDAEKDGSADGIQYELIVK